MSKTDLATDHASLDDALTARRYFAKFDRIMTHLALVAETMQLEGKLSKSDVAILGRYVLAISNTFEALSNKYLMTGRLKGPMARGLDMDRVESGFPIAQELMTMANDAHQAERHLRGMPHKSELKDEMIRKIVSDLEIPTKLQYAMSQRIYYEGLKKGELFWPQNDPEILWLGNDGADRRRYLVHWAVYDSQLNLPVIYLLELEDTGRTSLPKDQRRWPEAQAHLMAQSLTGLMLLTIAVGFDEDFDDLHPKRLRRLYVGPMYSSAFTLQNGPLRTVLEEADAPAGEDWALAWTMEELESERVEMERSGWFGTVEREIYGLDPFMPHGADTGATNTERAIILPQKPYQVLEEKRPKGFNSVRKFVVSPQGQVLSYR
jgi:hypothetical protein